MPRFAEAQQAALRFYPFGASRTFTQAMAPLAERHFDVFFSQVFENRLRYAYVLPPGFALAELPPEVVESSPFGALRIATRREGAKLVVEGTMTLATARISAKDYPVFRAWLHTGGSGLLS